MEAEFFAGEKDIGSEAFVRNLANILEDAKAMLAAKAEEFGIDVNELAQEEITEIRENKREFVKSDELTALAEKYAWDVAPVLDAVDQWIPEPDIEESTTNEVLAVLHWYRFFISAKIERGLHGIADEYGDENFEQLADPQSDANGSIKTALIAIERSILAWTFLLTQSNAESLRPFIQLLELIKRKAEDKFPRARDFIRPGFDEIDVVM